MADGGLNLGGVMRKKLKEALINLRVRPEVRDNFRVAADMRGSTMSGLLHQYIIRVIREEMENSPREFERRRQELEELTLTEVELEIDRIEAASPRRTSSGKLSGKATGENKKTKKN